MDGVIFGIPILGVITFRIEMFIVISMTSRIPILEAMTFRIEIQYSVFSDDFWN